MEQYELMTIEIVKFEAADVITTSCTGVQPGNTEIHERE